MRDLVVFLFATILAAAFTACEIKEKLPEDAVVLEQVIFIDEVQQGIPQTIQMPNGTVVTYKMPLKLVDGDVIKVRDMPGERPYYIKVKLQQRGANVK
ncbi:MAG TPA: hypothetical protein PLV42_00105 [bacterium]|nr:hypothetical protein [bacterium]